MHVVKRMEEDQNNIETILKEVVLHAMEFFETMNQDLFL
jgi:hypothetical protein